MGKMEVHFTVNGRSEKVTTKVGRTLLHVLRDDIGLKGAKEACGQGDCGACVVVMDGRAVNACLVLAVQAEGAEILTVEGLAVKGELHSLQKHFIERWAIQCGYCTPGMLMSAYALLLENADPSPDDVREAISGNLCRCTSYEEIVEAVSCAAVELSSEEAEEVQHA
jgi:carbon-monoxide dehydrogenase small subunit